MTLTGRLLRGPHIAWPTSVARRGCAHRGFHRRTPLAKADGPAKIQVLSHLQYQADTISPSSVLPCPLEQFQVWFKHAQDNNVVQPEAMSLATAYIGTRPDYPQATYTDEDKREDLKAFPSVRFVLLKQVDSRGFVFYTNYLSDKSDIILANPWAALAFYWRQVHRQVRVVGRVEQVDEAESDVYWRSRPRGSQIGAWASHQSSVVEDGEVATLVEEMERNFEGVEILPRPEHWGGWRVIPHEVEFWAGQPSRLHDRVLYTRYQAENDWIRNRLAP